MFSTDMLTFDLANFLKLWFLICTAHNWS